MGGGVVCLAGVRSLLHPKRKSSSHLSGGCAIVITTGKKSSSRLSGGCAIVITIRKKSSSHLSGGCMIVIRTGKKVLVICLAGAQCIKFECNEFVLVLVQIDLIHFEHSVCISST